MLELFLCILFISNKITPLKIQTMLDYFIAAIDKKLKKYILNEPVVDHSSISEEALVITDE